MSQKINARSIFFKSLFLLREVSKWYLDIFLMSFLWVVPWERERTQLSEEVGHIGVHDQKYSYCSSKSGQVGKSGFVPENTGCQKKIRRAQFFFKSLFLLRGFSKYHLKTSLRRNKLFKKNRICLIFFWHALCLNFFSGFCPDFGGW